MLSKQVAYEKWLGIKDQDQPPSLYRLLGVAAFESDADIISNSADSRMGYLRQFQIGDNARVAAEILNELSKARVVLLNANEKLAYDARLRQRITEKGATIGPANAPPLAADAPLRRAEAVAGPTRPVPAPAASSAFDLNSSPAEARPAHSRSVGRPKKKQNPLIWLAAAGIALAVGTLVVLKTLTGGGDAPPIDTPKAVEARAETPQPVANPAASEVAATSRLTVKRVAGNASNDVPGPPVAKPAAPTIAPPSATVPAPVVATVATAPKESPPQHSGNFRATEPAETPKAPATAIGTTAAAKLIPVPDASAQAGANKLINEIYGKEVAAAKTANQKRALATKLLGKAMESGNDRVAQFVLLRLSKDLSAQASDCQAALDAIQEIDKIFDIDAVEMNVEALKKCASTATTSEQHAILAEKAAEMSSNMALADNFPVAKPLIDLALGEARKAKDEAIIKQTSDLKIEVDKTAQAYEAARKAIAVLEKTPLDPDANLALGRYKCFVKADWESGLPKLALGTDPTLKALAETELKGVASPDEQERLGDQWWNAAEKQKVRVEKGQFRARATHWYQQALPALTGLQKDKAQKRLDEAKALADALPPLPGSNDKWVLLFKSSDPSIWNTNCREKDRFAVPIAEAPGRMRFLKMQMDPKNFIIIALTKDKLGTVVTREKIGWQGTNRFAWGGHQLGIFDPTWNSHSNGTCAISWQHGSEFTGWGFGYSNRQGYAWDEKPIGETVFEISVTSVNLTTQEKRHTRD